MKIYNKESLIEEKKNKGFGISSVFYDEKEKVIPGSMKTLVANSSGWNQNHANYLTFWNKAEVMRNKAREYYEKTPGKIDLQKIINSGYTVPNDLYDFIDLMRVDITANLLYEPDFSPLFCRFFSDNDFDEVVKLNQFYDYGAHFKQIEGNGDPVPLIEPKTGIEDTVEFKIFGVGFVRTLKSLLYDKLFDVQKLNQSIARAFAFSRNERTLEVLTSYGSYPAGQLSPANTDPDATLDQKRYRTIKAALEKMACLTMPQTDDDKKKLDITGGVYLVMNSCDVIPYTPVLNGRINSASAPEVLDPLSPWIRGIISYNGDRIVVGKEIFTLAGCPQGTAYLIAPGWFLVMIKRALSIQTSEGKALTLSQDQTAWWFSETEYPDDALLAVMKITLPT